MQEFARSQELDLLLNESKGKVVVLFFWADWHAPCGQVRTVLEELAVQYAGKVVLCGIEAEKEELAELGERFNIDSVPIVIVFEASGKQQDVIRGAQVDLLVQSIEKAVKKAEISGVVEELEMPKVQLETRLKALVSAAPVMLFIKGEPSAPQCKFTRALVELLRENYAKVQYGYFDILTDNQVREGLKEFANWKTYPQVWVNRKLIGGLDIIKELHEGQELEGIFADAVGKKKDDLNAKLKRLIESDPVMLFMKGAPDAPQCGFSSSIVQLLNRIGVKFEHFDILMDNEVREGLKEYSNWKTYPQLYVNGKLIGGLDIVRELDENGELLELFPAASLK
jgi:Grx4 family monothiol glutaredoxin